MLTKKENQLMKDVKNQLNDLIQDTQDNIELIIQFSILKPIIQFTIHKEVLINNTTLKKFDKDLQNIKNRFNIDPILSKLDDFYSTKKNEFLETKNKKQFLIDLYQSIFQSFCSKRADKDGVVYTPKEITNFMIRMTDQLSKKHFGKSIYDSNVSIIDPFVGSGNFIESLINQAPSENISYKLSNEIYANEIDPITHLIASLNIENAHFEKTNQYAPYNNLKLVDTFSLYEGDGYHGL